MTTPADDRVEPERSIGLWDPLRLRSFRLLWLGESISLVGDQFYFVALPWLVIALTGSGLAVGTVLMAGAIPRAALMLFGGAITDRYAPRTVMLVSNLARFGLATTVGVLAFTSASRLWHLCALTVGFGIFDALFFPALSTFVPRVVPAIQLRSANALLGGSNQFAALVGPALGGIVIAALGTSAAFLFDAGTFFVASLCLLALGSGVGRGANPTRSKSDESATPSMLASIREGLAYAARDETLRIVILLIALVSFGFAGPFWVGLSYILKQRLHAGAGAFGAIFSTAGGGTLAGTLAASSRFAKGRRGRNLLVGVAVCGLGFVALGLAPSIVAVLVAVAAMEFVAGFVNVQVMAWLQERTDPAMLGRVMSLLGLSVVGTAPVSHLLAGVLVVQSATLLLVGAGALILLGVVVGVLTPALRRFD